MDHAAYLERARGRGVNPIVYWLVRGVLQVFFHLYFRLSRIGREHIPNEGPVIVAANHRSFLDPLADATGAKRHEESWWLGFLAELRKHLGDCSIVEVAPPDGRSRLSSAFPAFSSTSVREVAALISNLTCFISADCGVMHLASASGTPTIGLFSATDPAKYEPYGNGSQAIQTSGKSPEEVAQLARAIIERIRLRGVPERIHFDRCTQASPGSPS